MFEIIYQDNHLIAIDKPAGVLSQSDSTGDPSVVDEVAEYLRTTFQKPGNVYVGLLHRLDRPVSGVMILARTSKAAERVSAQFREGTVQKSYLAVVEGLIQETTGTFRDYLTKDPQRNVVSVDPSGRLGKSAVTDFEVIESDSRATSVRLRPRTGRSHQLRVQLASRGWPILGDKKYGASTPFESEVGGFRIALHAEAIEFVHPVKRLPVVIRSPLPGDWPRY